MAKASSSNARSAQNVFRDALWELVESISTGGQGDPVKAGEDLLTLSNAIRRLGEIVTEVEEHEKFERSKPRGVAAMSDEELERIAGSKSLTEKARNPQGPAGFQPAKAKPDF